MNEQGPRSHHFLLTCGRQGFVASFQLVIKGRVSVWSRSAAAVAAGTCGYLHDQGHGYLSEASSTGLAQRLVIKLLKEIKYTIRLG